METFDNIKIGTCAWSYDDWRGPFYPDALPPAGRLAYYARRFSAVEVDATFYHAPAPEVARHWAECTPEDFVFNCKAPREITHERRLRECEEPLDAFLQSLEPLAGKLGCVLVQLPPSFRPRFDEMALRSFVRALPASVRFAIEFRDSEWHMPRIVHLLEQHRVCWAWTDTTPLDHQQEGAFEFLPQTTDFACLRLLGDLDSKYGADGGRRFVYREQMWSRDRSLENWAIRLRQCSAKLQRTFVHVSNHFEGFAPITARRLAALLGQSVPAFGPEDVGKPGEEQEGQLPLL